MATRTSQRVGIWIIAVVMLVGTLGAFFLPILMSESQSKEAAEQQKLLEEYQKEMAKCPAGEVTEKKITPSPVPPEAPVLEDVPELRTVDLTVGDGAEVKAGDCVEILYHGTLASNGEAFTGGSNYESGVPYRSQTTGFVPGFAEGLVGMKVGGERQIQIPSAKAYGDKAAGEIPANADLIFTIRLVGIYTQ